MRRRRMYIVFPAIAAALLLYGSAAENAAAFFTDSDTAENTMKIGINTLTPHENYEKPQAEAETVKAPYAENSGSVSCYVRAEVFLSDSRIDLDYLSYVDSEHWIRNTSDGWFYYSDILAPGEVTVPLFDRVRLNEAMDENIAEKKLTVLFSSVQSEGFETAQEAFAAITAAETP